MHEIRNTKPLKTYLLYDSTGDKLKSSFYPYELEKAEPDYTLHKRVNKIHSRRMQNGEQEYLVSFHEFPPNKREWINEE